MNKFYDNGRLRAFTIDLHYFGKLRWSTRASEFGRMRIRMNTLFLLD